MSTSFEKRHRPDILSYPKRQGGDVEPAPAVEDFLLLEDDPGDGSSHLLLEDDPGDGSSGLLLESST